MKEEVEACVLSVQTKRISDHGHNNAASDSPTPPFWIKTTSLGFASPAKWVDAPKRVTPILLPLRSLTDLISGLAQASMVRTGNGDPITIRSLPLRRLGRTAPPPV